MKVIVQEVPGQPDRVPQTVVLPSVELLMITFTPGWPLVQCSYPVRSLAPMIFDVMVVPTRRA